MFTWFVAYVEVLFVEASLLVAGGISPTSVSLCKNRGNLALLRGHSTDGSSFQRI